MQYLSSFVFSSFIYFFPFRNNNDEYKVEQLKEEKRKRAKYSKLIECPCLNDYYNQDKKVNLTQERKRYELINTEQNNTFRVLFYASYVQIKEGHSNSNIQ